MNSKLRYLIYALIIGGVGYLVMFNNKLDNSSPTKKVETWSEVLEWNVAITTMDGKTDTFLLFSDCKPTLKKSFFDFKSGGELVLCHESEVVFFDVKKIKILDASE